MESVRPPEPVARRTPRASARDTRDGRPANVEYRGQDAKDLQERVAADTASAHGLDGVEHLLEGVQGHALGWSGDEHIVGLAQTRHCWATHLLRIRVEVVLPTPHLACAIAMVTAASGGRCWSSVSSLAADAWREKWTADVSG